MELELRPIQLTRLLAIDSERLASWAAAGLFGEALRSVGHGVRRVYSFSQCVLACVIREVMDITRSRLLPDRVSMEELRQTVGELPRDPSAETQQETTAWVVIRWESGREEWRFTFYSSGQRSPGLPKLHAGATRTAGQALLLVPLSEIATKVREFFVFEEAKQASRQPA